MTTSGSDVSEDENPESVPFEKRLKMMKDGYATQQEAHEVVLQQETKNKGKKKNKKIKVGKRKHKNAPTVMSSKKPVGRFRQVVEVKKREVRDPRFTSWTGELDQSKFREAYDFLSSYSKDEIKKLKKAINKSKDKEESKKLQAVLTRLQQYQSSQSRGKVQDEQNKKWRRKRRDQIKQGHRPFYPKRQQLREERATQQFEKLEKSGKLDRAMAKKRARKQERKGRDKKRRKEGVVPWAK